jgi:hypothetical protein
MELEFVPPQAKHVKATRPRGPRSNGLRMLCLMAGLAEVRRSRPPMAAGDMWPRGRPSAGSVWRAFGMGRASGSPA